MGKVCFGWIVCPSAWGWPPVLFAAAVGVACEGLSRTLSPKDPNGKPLLPGVVLSMTVGGLILNTPMGRWLGLRDAKPEHPLARLKWSEGLSFVDKTLLRLAVILLGFNIPPLFRGGETSSEYGIAVACVVVPIAQLVAFLAVQGTGRLLRMDREAQDMVSVGSMICGASAINAYSASLQVADADGEEDEGQRKAKAERLSSATALSISSIFCMSLVSLLAFRPIARAFDVSDPNAGLWAGLAVGDLSSSIAVGSQFDENGEVFASIAKACRILTLAPILMLLGFRNAYADRNARNTQNTSFLQTMWANFPLFMVGLLATMALRVALDAVAPEQAHTIDRVGKVLSLINKGFFVSVTAAIGLRIKVGVLLQSWRFLLAAAVGSLSISATSLAMVQLALAGAADADSGEEMAVGFWRSLGAGLGAICLAATFFLGCVCAERRRQRAGQGPSADSSSNAASAASAARGRKPPDAGWCSPVPKDSSSRDAASAGNRLPTVKLGGQHNAVVESAGAPTPKGGAEDLQAVGTDQFTADAM